MDITLAALAAVAIAPSTAAIAIVVGLLLSIYVVSVVNRIVGIFFAAYSAVILTLVGWFGIAVYVCTKWREYDEAKVKARDEPLEQVAEAVRTRNLRALTVLASLYPTTTPEARDFMLSQGPEGITALRHLANRTPKVREKLFNYRGVLDAATLHVRTPDGMRLLHLLSIENGMGMCTPEIVRAVLAARETTEDANVKRFAVFFLNNLYYIEAHRTYLDLEPGFWPALIAAITHVEVEVKMVGLNNLFALAKTKPAQAVLIPGAIDTVLYCITDGNCDAKAKVKAREILECIVKHI